LQDSADRFVRVPTNTRHARNVIAEQKLHVLLYADIGSYWFFLLSAAVVLETTAIA
jgi:hypothetical protein